MSIPLLLEKCNTEQQFSLTIFTDVKATNKETWTGTLDDLGNLILATSAPEKSKLPLLSGCSFGTALNSQGCLRHNANVERVFAIVADYDGEALAFDAAVGLIAGAGLTALLYTSASHTALKPRWRVLCPLSAPCTPADYSGLMGRLNGILGGVLARESWIISQSFFYGFVTDSPDQDLQILSGAYIDLRDDLDAGAIGKPGGKGVAGDGKPKTQGELRAFDPEWLSRLVDKIDSQNDDYSEWISAGLAIKGAGLEFETFETYSVKSESFQDDTDFIDKKWQGFAADMAGERAVLKLLQRHGIDTSAYESAAGLAEAQEAFTAEPPPGEDIAPPPAARKRFSISRIMPLDHSIRIPEFMENWYGVGEFLRLNGAPGSGKTTLAVDQGVHIAAGLPWRGNKVQQGAVLFIELEGAAGLQTRIEATCTELGLRQNELPLYMITDNLSLAVEADAGDLLAEIIAAIPEMAAPLRLIVIDTQARASAGADENSASDAAIVIRAIDDIRAASGAAVMLLHHLPHGGDRARGSGAYLGAVDCELLGSRDDLGLGVVKCVKMRNRPEPKPFYYRLKSVPIGCGPDGGLVTGACAVAADPPAKGTGKALKGNAATAMNALHTLVASGNAPTRAAWVAAFTDTYAGKASGKSVIDIFNRAAAELVAAGRVTIAGDFVAIAGSVQSPQTAWAELLDGPLQ
jgi:hypothetical protein